MTANSAIIRTLMSARRHDLLGDVLRPAGIVKSAKQAQISGQTVAYPANAG
jgi:hypothetical protein